MKRNVLILVDGVKTNVYESIGTWHISGNGFSNSRQPLLWVVRVISRRGRVQLLEAKKVKYRVTGTGTDTKYRQARLCTSRQD